MDAFGRIADVLGKRLDRLEGRTPDVLEGAVSSVSPLRVWLNTGGEVDVADSMVDGLAVTQKVRLIAYGGFKRGKRLLIIGRDAAKPTAPIRGSNGYGVWELFPERNNFQVCRISTIRTDIQATSAYGPLFIGGWEWTFPRSFATPPVVTVGRMKYGGSASWGITIDTDTDSASLRIFDYYSRAAGTNTAVELLAVGEGVAQ